MDSSTEYLDAGRPRRPRRSWRGARVAAWVAVAVAAGFLVAHEQQPGRAPAPPRAVPPVLLDGAHTAYPDGHSGLLVATDAGVYDVRAGTTRLVSRGSLLATGSSAWLMVECPAETICRIVEIDADGARRVIGPAPSAGVLPYGDTSPYGAVAPDGRRAAIFVPQSGGGQRLQLLDLAAGTRRDVDADVPPGPGALRWSPDSRVLRVLDRAGRPEAVDPESGQATALPAPVENDLTPQSRRPLRVPR